MEKNSCYTKVIVHPASIEILANATWDFAKRVLWREFNFGEDEILLSKSYIREHFEDIPAEKFQEQSFPRFKLFCERIIAAKENYWDAYTHPCLWFNKQNSYGFSKSVAEHRQEMKDRYRDDILFFNQMRKDPLLSEIFKNDKSFNPIKPIRYGIRSN